MPPRPPGYQCLPKRLQTVKLLRHSLQKKWWHRKCFNIQSELRDLGDTKCLVEISLALAQAMYSRAQLLSKELDGLIAPWWPVLGLRQKNLGIGKVTCSWSGGYFSVGFNLWGETKASWAFWSPFHLMGCLAQPRCREEGLGPVSTELPSLCDS